MKRSAALLLLALATAGCGASRHSGAERPHILAKWAQITDAHVVDEESPARLEMLDRLGSPFTSAFRPPESLSGRVLTAMVRAINRERPDGVVVTGDLIDNAQANELAEALTILRGGRVDPSSGSRRYQGVQSRSNPDPFYYRPDVDPPREPGLLSRAQRPFKSPGLHAPWYPLVGNHDLLVQGNFAPTARTNAIATGPRKLVSLDRTALDLARRQRLQPALADALLAGRLPGRTKRVAADPRRRELSPAEVLARLRRASGRAGAGALLDYTFALGAQVRGIALDTVRRHGGAGGLVRREQITWLRGELDRAGDRWVIVFSHAPLASCENGDRALALLERDPRVVASVAGDTHRNSVERRGRLVLVTTSSLADWPQQARMFELSARRAGGAILETWTISPDLGDPLAHISHRLAYLDYQGGRPQAFAGSRSDRRTKIVIPAAGR